MHDIAISKQDSDKNKGHEYNKLNWGHKWMKNLGWAWVVGVVVVFLFLSLMFFKFGELF